MKRSRECTIRPENLAGVRMSETDDGEWEVAVWDGEENLAVVISRAEARRFSTFIKPRRS